MRKGWRGLGGGTALPEAKCARLMLDRERNGQGPGVAGKVTTSAGLEWGLSGVEERLCRQVGCGPGELSETVGPGCCVQSRPGGGPSGKELQRARGSTGRPRRQTCHFQNQMVREEGKNGVGQKREWTRLQIWFLTFDLEELPEGVGQEGGGAQETAWDWRNLKTASRVGVTLGIRLFLSQWSSGEAILKVIKEKAGSMAQCVGVGVGG